MQVLIVGAGIAGPTLAYWLSRDGHAVTLLERAPAFRAGGYIIDFWGAGFDVAEEMGLIPELRQRGYPVTEVRLVHDTGRRAGGFSAAVFDRATQGRYVSVRRGDLACAIYERLSPRVERLFGDEVCALAEARDAVHVQLARAGARTFDLVIGADGLHSSIRRLTFGADADCERYLGYEVAALELAGYRPRDEGVYVLYAERGRQVARFAMSDDRTLFLLVYAQPDAEPLPSSLDAQRARLRTRFAGAGWECERVLAALSGASDIYLDHVSQIRIPAWTRGRMALIGDAAHCVSLVAGQGAALSMMSARVLAGELQAAHGDHVRAFTRYEQRLRPYLAAKQQQAEGFASAFAPRTKLGLGLRVAVSKLMRFSPLAQLIVRRSLRDAIALPQYG